MMCNWPRHDLSSFKRKVKERAKFHPGTHFGESCKDKHNEAFIPVTASGNSSEWEESEKITSQGRKKTQTSKKENEGRARGGGGQSSEIRVTLRHSGTCSAYKLKERPKLYH